MEIAKQKFLILEGIDGSGKDKLSSLLQEKIQANSSFFYGSDLIITREPRINTASGKAIEAALIDYKKANQLPSSPALAKLYIEDRWLHTKQIRKWLSEGKTVLSLRYDISTYAYQSVFIEKEKIDFFFENVYRNHLYGEEGGSLIPSISFHLNLAVSLTMKRIQERSNAIHPLGNTKDTGLGAQSIYEKRSFQEKVARQYISAIAFLKAKDGRKIYSLDASQEPKKVFHEMSEILQQHRIAKAE